MNLTVFLEMQAIALCVAVINTFATASGWSRKDMVKEFLPVLFIASCVATVIYLGGDVLRRTLP